MHVQVTMMRMLRHRHVVQFYGASLQPDYFFIVTELMSGGIPATGCKVICTC